MMNGHLYLMGEIRTPFKREWIFPLGTTTLEGRELPAPANTDEFLTATYGPSWRVPDPAYVFETPESTHRRLNGWFRGTRVNRAEWDRTYSGHNLRDVDLTPSIFADGCAASRRRPAARRRPRLRPRRRRAVVRPQGSPRGRARLRHPRAPRPPPGSPAPEGCPWSSATSTSASCGRCSPRRPASPASRGRGSSPPGTSPTRPTRSGGGTCGGSRDDAARRRPALPGVPQPPRRGRPRSRRRHHLRPISATLVEERAAEHGATIVSRKVIQDGDTSRRPICRMVVEWQR